MAEVLAQVTAPSPAKAAVSQAPLDDEEEDMMDDDDVEEIEPDEAQTLWMSCSPGRQSSGEEDDDDEEAEETNDYVITLVCSFLIGY